MEWDLTAGCWATMTPKRELIKMMERVGKLLLLPEKNQFQMDYLQRQRERAIDADLVIARQKEQWACYMDDQALQVSNASMMVSNPLAALTQFIPNFKSRVFAHMQSASPQELNKEYGLPTKGKSNK